jgi:hypothetical protein
VSLPAVLLDTDVALAVYKKRPLPLATLNLKDFEDFQDHHGLRIVRP